MGTHPIFESDFDCLTEAENMLFGGIRQLGRRQFSQYMKETYGVKHHRLAKKPGIQIDPVEVVGYSFAMAILLMDIVRDQVEHRRIWEANGAPDEVWNQHLFLTTGVFSHESQIRTWGAGA